MPEIVLALTTVPHDFDASALARSLVESRVAACVTMLPGVRSVYTWQGAVQEDGEQQLVIKTTRDRVQDAWAALKARHPYDVPEFLVLSVVEGNPDYLKWVGESVGPGEAGPRST
jgi:periplasmic divalent cation tolerance protein